MIGGTGGQSKEHVEPVSQASDQTVRVGELVAAVEAFRDARDWRRFHPPKNLAMAIAIEAAELMEIFQWVAGDDSAAVADGSQRDHVAEELADVLIYCLTLASALDLDVSTVVLDKIAANGHKYPVGHAPDRADS
jgi:NTP pyrophosphatase (non-canonical NTP hydrolase)